ncbi:1-phosphofructokinase family hexose kinase [Sphingomonas sinipercae]|uniref:Phosphofructokinase n=1 Tax=Sphingomonas sinipercae TaxID=2714944 RepID=A0A6G7ZQW1_9SPHN|nr:1-phosphofructokinase family hexose kinase [Sphingomonas sinipercae]
MVTLTLNPAIDVSSEADEVRHTHKIRTSREELEAGGGGINVARVLTRLGADVRAVFLAGGATGHALDELLARTCVDRRRIEIAGDTRLSLTVMERATGHEYRFVPEGPEVSDSEWSAALEAIAGERCDYLVASGSLPRGVPADFYVRLAKALGGRGVRLVLDTSGEALEAALAHGGLFLIKPSRSELEHFAGTPLPNNDDVIAAARQLVDQGRAEHVAVSLGGEGAIFVSRDGSHFAPALDVPAQSAVGAGDSFVAGMVFGFSRGLPPDEAFRLGMAAGAAAVLTCGSEIARADDVWRLFGGRPADRATT